MGSVGLFVFSYRQKNDPTDGFSTPDAGCSGARRDDGEVFVVASVASAVMPVIRGRRRMGVMCLFSSIDWKVAVLRGKLPHETGCLVGRVCIMIETLLTARGIPVNTRPMSTTAKAQSLFSSSGGSHPLGRFTDQGKTFGPRIVEEIVRDLRF